jgi:small-conductance mechanosensitive channel
MAGMKESLLALSMQISSATGLPLWLVDSLQVVVLVFLGLVVLKVLLSAFDRFARRASLEPLAMRPLRTGLRWVGFAAIAGLVFGKFGMNLFVILSTVLTLVAIGFVAVWSVLSHFLCTYLIVLFRPFRVGDRVDFPGEDIGGRVVEMTNLFTILEDGRGARFHVPNNAFFQKTIKIGGPHPSPAPPARAGVMDGKVESRL